MSAPLNIIRTLDPDIAIVALGANLDSRVGVPAQTFAAVCSELAALAAGELRCSSFHQTVPEDCPPDSPPFLNAVVLFRVAGAPSAEQLLDQLQALENSFGRARSGVVNAPRSLDLDLIAYGNREQASADLTLPHPRATQRLFVLEPLAELAPQLKLPGCIVSVQVLVDNLRKP